LAFIRQLYELANLARAIAFSPPQRHKLLHYLIGAIEEAEAENVLGLNQILRIMKKDLEDRE
jgi:hypothetical protein